jgi:endoglucanase
VWTLALAYEEFDVDWDQTTIDQHTRIVEIHLPDGKPDVLQQVEHGVLSILGGYRNLGRLYRGIICNDLRQYVLLGDGAAMTDGLKYNPELGENERTGTESGKSDDRWVFTEEHPGREYIAIQALAAAARVLLGYNDTLARQCLQAAVELYDMERDDSPRWATGRINATVELLVSTGNDKYKNDLLAMQEQIIGNINSADIWWPGFITICKRMRFTKCWGSISKAAERFGRTAKRKSVRSPYNIRIWGDGWGIQRLGMQHYFLHKNLPENVR